jgi:lipoate-protein ligase A
LDTEPRPAAENMALDEIVLTARSRGVVPNTLRFLQFSPACTLVGYHQAVEQEMGSFGARANWGGKSSLPRITPVSRAASKRCTN